MERGFIAHAELADESGLVRELSEEGVLAQTVLLHKQAVKVVRQGFPAALDLWYDLWYDLLV